MMKAPSPIFLFVLFLLSALPACEKDDSIPISDNYFLKALIARGVDLNGDGSISPGEAEQITFLNVAGDSIGNMSGIEAFINLDTLYCSSNMLNSSIDVSACPALEYLYCDYNQLSEIDVSKNPALYHLYLTYMPSLEKVGVWLRNRSGIPS